MNGNETVTATTSENWQDWLLRVAETGLQAKWDAEYVERFGVARQTPATPVGQGSAGAIIPVPSMPTLSPAVLLGGGLAIAAALYFLLRD